MEGERRKMLPIGIEDFGKLRNNGYYYVDKTQFIQELLDNLMEVNLFLRPRRFGKTLALSTMRHYFEDTFNEETNAMRRALFDSLHISGQSSKYAGWQTSRPVISITLKSMWQDTFESSFYAFKREAMREYARLGEIALRNASQADAAAFGRIADGAGSVDEYKYSLALLSQMLHMSTGEKPIILIDEYDVPLDGAYVSGYYPEMINFIRPVFENALKTNENLEFAVITGCLRVSQESIFTGLNNLFVASMLRPIFGEYFGFTQTEVDGVLAYYGLSRRREDLRAWYNGYQIGGVQVYNPWSVLNCLVDFAKEGGAPCVPHWGNTSSNSIVKRLIANAGADERECLEILMSGGCIERPIGDGATYADLSGHGLRPQTYSRHVRVRHLYPRTMTFATLRTQRSNSAFSRGKRHRPRVYDTVNDRLFCARSFFGIKPLYYTHIL